MKKFLSLIMVAAMLVAVFAMVGCDKTGDETTTEAPVVETTTKAPETTTAAPETTTQAPETTTKAPETTTTAAPETTTKAPETTTTAAPVETTTTVTEPTTAVTTTGSTLGVFDRFDFGKDSKAQAEGETSHEYIVANLTIDSSRVAVEWTDDTVKIYAIKSYGSGDGYDANNGKAGYSLLFSDIVTYDFDDELIPGWGTWSGAPLNPGTSWVGRYQYAKLRILNNTANNIVSMHWHRAGEGFATTTACGSMYLQGGAATADDHKLTADIKEEWAEYYYDMMFLASVGREINYVGKASYMTVVNEAKARGGYAGNNWNTANGNITGVAFHFLGAYGKDKINDTRKNIKMGDSVEVDYIVFGCSIEQLEAYTSNMQDAAK